MSKADLLLLGELLAGVSGHLVDRLQLVLNHSTRLVYSARGSNCDRTLGQALPHFCLCLKTACSGALLDTVSKANAAKDRNLWGRKMSLKMTYSDKF